MIKSLNGIRALLFLFIFGTHFKYKIIYSELGMKLFKFFNLGGFTVLAFILISGFCMSIGYSEYFKQLSIKNFFEYLDRRLYKIYPLYIISGLFGLIFVYLHQGINWLYLFIFVYAPMLTTWLGIDAGANSAGWFICDIFFCYMITPIMLYLFNKKDKLKFHIIFCFINYLILLIFSIYLVLRHDAGNEYLYRLPLIRAFEYVIALDIGFIFFKLLKIKFEHKIFNNYAVKSIIDIIFIASFLTLMYALPNNLLYRHLFGIPLMCTFLLYICIQKRSILYDILSSKICNFLANISFECYLIHILIFNLLDKYTVRLTYSKIDVISIYFMLLCLTIIAAYIYKKIEIYVKNIIRN